MTFSGLAMISGCLLLGFALEGRGPLAVARAARRACRSPAVLLTFTRGAYVGILAALRAPTRRCGGREACSWLAPRSAGGLPRWRPPGSGTGSARSADLSDPTNRDRIAMVRAGARMVRDSPVFGLGPDMVKPYYPLYRDPDAPRWRRAAPARQRRADRGGQRPLRRGGLPASSRSSSRGRPCSLRARAASGTGGALGGRAARRGGADGGGPLRVQLRRHRGRDGDAPRLRRCPFRAAPPVESGAD